MQLKQEIEQNWQVRYHYKSREKELFGLRKRNYAERTHSIGKSSCLCNHCHIGDFVFDNQDDFLVYYEALKPVLEAQASGHPMQIHCHMSGKEHMAA